MDTNTAIVFGAVVVFFVLKLVGGKRALAQLKKLPQNAYTLLDVRTSAETAEGMLKGAVNIPLHELPSKLKFMDRTKPVYIYCASGSRSTEAVSLLKQAGFSAHNLGAYGSLKGSF